MLVGLAARGKSWYDNQTWWEFRPSSQTTKRRPAGSDPDNLHFAVVGEGWCMSRGAPNKLFAWGEVTMVGSIRRVRVALAYLALLVAFGVSSPAALASDEKPKAAQASEPSQDGKRAAASAKLGQAADSRAEVLETFAQPGDDTAQPFVPLRPATVEDRRRTDVLRLFGAARALEDRRQWSDAAALLQEALKIDPDSVAIARRLSRIYVGALGRPDLAVQYSKRVLAAEPSDSDTLTRLVDFYNQTNDPASAEALVQEVLANPKLEAHAPGRLMAQFELGSLYAGPLHDVGKAADAFAKVIEALDDKSANRLSGRDQQRVLGNDPGVSYLKFGLMFLAAKRLEPAAKAFERGLVYDEDNPQISLLMADTLLKLNQGERALSLVERSIQRQPQGVESYELLARVLTALKREKEITPRLEEAARRDSKNVPLQYVLADRYRETGQAEKAETLYKELLNSQPTPQTYGALAASLFKRKKAADLLRVFSEAFKRPGSPEAEAVAPQLKAAAADSAIAEAMLDSGLDLLSFDPPRLPPKSAFEVLAVVANWNRGPARRNRGLEKLVKLRHLQLEQSPSPIVYSEIADAQSRLGRFADAATTVLEMIAKYPTEKTARVLSFLADFHRKAGHNEALKQTVNEALKLEPADGDSQIKLAYLLSDIGQLDGAARVLREASKREPNNWAYDATLGGLLSKFGRDEEAIKILESLLKRFPDNEDVIKLVRQTLSIAYVNLGNFVKGEAELEILLQKFPEDPGPNNDLGYLYAEQGKNLEKAEVMIRKALSEEPSSKAYLDSLGWVLFKRGKAKEALEPLKRAVERMKSEVEQGGTADATILEHLGDVYFQLHEVDKAVDIWKEAALAAEQAVPPDKRLVEIRKKLGSLEKLGSISRPTTSRTP
jgi:tetratricopeptide (TPR) repeat protein